MCNVFSYKILQIPLILNKRNISEGDGRRLSLPDLLDPDVVFEVGFAECGA